MPTLPLAWKLAKACFTVLLLSVVAACGGGGGGDGDSTPPAVAPALTISSDAPGTATGPFTLSFSFSAKVSEFATNRILVGGGFLNGATLTRVGDTLYTLVVTPTPNRVGVAEVTVQAGAFKDATGAAASTRAYSFSQPYDTVVVSNEPLLTITHDLVSGAATGPIRFTFDFSNDVGTSFTPGSVEVTGGTITAFNRESATRYSMQVTPPAATTGLVLLRVRAGAFASAGGVPSGQEYSAGVLYQTP